ncbi:MAG: oxidoreductase [Bacteroidota bacterium]
MNTQQVILITGASAGIGKASAEQFIKEGHLVYGAARRLENMQDLVDAGGHAIAMDITKEEEINTTVQQIIDEQGRIDVLINNAGYAIYGSVEDIPLHEARRQFDVNIFGLAAITKEVIPYMREAKKGKIVNVSSVGGKIYTPLGAWYHATKHALEGWSDCLRLELQSFGIDVVIVEPGAIKTEFGDVMHGPMMKYSGEGDYKDLATKMAGLLSTSYKDPKQTSPPSVIADVMSDIVKTDKPKTRYAAGKLASQLLFFRKYFSDRFFDRTIMSQIK